MPVSGREVVAGAALLATAAGLAYTVLAASRVRAFRRSAIPPQTSGEPPVTVLKPLHGDEPDLYENLRSFCEQEYPEFQVIFCSADPADPALECARRLQREFAHRNIEIAAGGAQNVRNPKVGNLLGAIERAKHELLVIADSDIRVDARYLRNIAASFGDPAVGAATCVYGGVPGANVASQLGAMFVNDQFAPSVLVAAALEPLTYCFGATMAVRADVLERIGGLRVLGDRLGDDYVLGNLVARAGYRVALCPNVVHTSVHERDWKALWLHELRWARTIRAQRPAGYAGSVLTYPLAFAVLFALTAGSPAWGALAIGAALAARMLLHAEARKTFAPQVRDTIWLLPVRDALSFGVWCAGLSGQRVAWKDRDYAVDANGRLVGNPDRV